MEKETLEEAAERYAEPYRCPATNENEYCRHDIISAINFGAKWQQERMYSEEEVKFQANKLLNDLLYKQGFNTNVIGGIVNEWFEQFKKK